MSDPATLRSAAQTLAAPLPPLLVAAEHLASTVTLGEHGRRRAGMGDEFWQYRPTHDGDDARMIDWRRSARSDGLFSREKEWQAAQSIYLWVDRSFSMDFTSSKDLPSKGELGATLVLALSVLMLEGGERVGMMDAPNPPRPGKAQLLRLANVLGNEHEGDYGTPQGREIRAHSRALMVSDFLGNFEAFRETLGRAADRGVKGVLLQILDPQEEAFPFDGRTIFESMSGKLRHETQKAGDLRNRYLDRLAQRKQELSDLARHSGWQYSCHHSDRPSAGALLWLYGALGRVH